MGMGSLVVVWRWVCGFDFWWLARCRFGLAAGLLWLLFGGGFVVVV